VGEPHIFTITVTQQPDGATPAATANIGYTLSATPSSESSTCGAAVPFVSNVATCTVTINNNLPGVFTANASASFTIDGVVINRTTNGTAPNTGPAVKTYVGALLHIVKQVVPSSDTTEFLFTPGGWGTGTFLLGHGDSAHSGWIMPGTYSASETLNSNFDLTDRSCVYTGTATEPNWSTSGDNGVSVTLANGEEVTCTFTNKRLPTLKVVKAIQGQPETFDFNSNIPEVQSELGAPFSITVPTVDGQNQTSIVVISAKTGNTIDEVDPGEDWLFDGAGCTGVTAGTVIQTVWGVEFESSYGDVITCTFTNLERGGATRTQGFWATHTELANIVWNDGTLPPPNETWAFDPVIGSGDEFLCTTNAITTGAWPVPPNPAGQNQLMGGFWANIANKADPLLSNKDKGRDRLEKARMQFLQQYFAAVLNVHLFNTPIPDTDLATARAAYCSNNVKDINDQKTFLANYNESGDSEPFTPGINATPQESRDQADILFWDETER